ncbi:hypothetical protein Tco_0935799 [Tanacetum coccineum]
MEAEFIALELASQEAKWLRNLLAYVPLWKKQFVSVSIHCDSQAAIGIAIMGKGDTFGPDMALLVGVVGEEEPLLFTYSHALFVTKTSDCEEEPCDFLLVSSFRILPLANSMTSDCEEEPCDFLLVSSFRILPLANSMVITPSGAELDKDVLKVSQVSGKVPRSHKP